MKFRIGTAIATGLLSAACSQIELKAPETVPIATTTPSPAFDVNRMRPADLPILRPVEPNMRLSAKERKYLDESIPVGARRVLENAGRFELLGEIDKDESSESDNRSFVPNRLIAITNETEKLAILNAFYLDAAKEDSPAICYEPHHAIRAESEGEIVEIEICFSCSRFVLKHRSKEYSGTIVREGRRSEELIESIFKRSASGEQ